MKKLNYLNAVLTVIAFSLVAITLAVTGILPKAYAGNKPLGEYKNYVSVPLNADGSMNVKIINNKIDVNIESCSPTAFYYAEPIEVKIKD